MNRNKMVARLKNIRDILGMSDEELLNKFSFLTEEKLCSRSRSAIICGIVEAEIGCLIKEIESGEIKNG